MGMEHYQQARLLIRKHLDLLYFTRPSKEDLIVKAEIALGVEFPPLYRLFLSEWGFIRFAGAEIYGIADSDFTNTPVSNDIRQTLELRRYGLPNYLILISFLDDGEYAALDTRSSYEPDQCPVIDCAPGIYQLSDQPEKLAEDFGQFFLNEVVRALKFHKRM
jgi:antitoxin YobK